MVHFPLDAAALTALVKIALDEDQAFNDITTIATIVSDRRARATLVARGTGTICGVPLGLEVVASPSADDFARTLKADSDVWGPFVRRVGFTAES